MVKDAEAHAEEDKKRKEEVEVKNAAESLINATEKTLEEAGDVATAEQKSKVEEAKEDLKKAMEGDDIEDIKTKTEALQTAMYDISAAMYQKAQEEAASAASAEEGATSSAEESSDEDIVDADYEVVDDDEKQS